MQLPHFKVVLLRGIFFENFLFYLKILFFALHNFYLKTVFLIISLTKLIGFNSTIHVNDQVTPISRDFYKTLLHRKVFLKNDFQKRINSI